MSATPRGSAFVLFAVASLFLPACDDPFFTLYDGGSGAPSDAGAASDATHCIDLEVSLFNYPYDAGASAIVPYGQDRVLFAPRGDGPPYYSGDLAGPKLEAMISTPGFQPESAVVRGDEIWLGGRDGTLWRGRPMMSEPFTQVSTVSAGEGLRWIAASDVGADFEIYALGDPLEKGRLYRFDGARFTLLYEKIATPDPDFAGFGGVAWIAPHEAYFVPSKERCSSGQVCLVHVFDEGGVTRLVEEAPQTGNPISTVSFWPGFGLLAGDSMGFVFVRTDGWRELAHAFLGAGPVVRAIRPYHGGIVVVSDRQAAQYYSDRGLCEMTADIKRDQGGIVPTVTNAQPFLGGVAVIGDVYGLGDILGSFIVLKEL